MAGVNTGTKIQTEPSLAFRQWVDTIQAALTGIQHGGSLQIDVDPYLSGVSVHPATAPQVNQTLVMGMVILGGLLLVSLLWR
ncbi:MAG: hypothetical protein J7M34_13580 [Anaerolineae bacterium]|nr:hypothetical protein [Anaerolineae bacterium]